MKLTYEERTELRTMFKAQISVKQNKLNQHDLDEVKIKSEVDNGNYELETIINKMNSCEKIENALKMVNLLIEKITITSVAKSANISYNTAKKYKIIIINKEELRLNTQTPLL